MFKFKFVFLFIVVGTGLISCVSSMKTPVNFRSVASVKMPEQQYEKFEVIAAQGQNYDFNNNSRPKKLELDELEKMASTSNMELSEGQLLTDNDAAFQKKVDIIKGAEKEIRMAYYIYANDGTASEFNRVILEKAKTVKIKLLVDFVTNYKNLDLFNMLVAKSNRNIDVRFYNYPSKGMFSDAAYIAMPCLKNEPAPGEIVQKFECRSHKNTLMPAINEKLKKNIFPPNGQLLMSGIFGKNGTALKVALGYLAEVDPAQYKSLLATHGKDKFTKRDAFSLVKLVRDALIKNQFFAKIKLAIAMTTFEAGLNPLVNEITGRFPLLDSKSENLWEHFTDYSHHKLLLADHNEFILGGRNIEDSYHMKALGKKGKYVFMDTDFWGHIKNKNAGVEMAASFDKLFDNDMSATLNQVNEEMPNDFITNTQRSDPAAQSVAEMSVGYCVGEKQKDPTIDFATCINESLPAMPGFKNREARVDAQFKLMQETKTQVLLNPGEKDESLRKFKDYVARPLNYFPKLSGEDLKTAKVFYLENTHLNKGNKRITGSKFGSEIENGKIIHQAWYRSLEGACVTAREMKKADKSDVANKTYIHAIFHTAYLFMPAGLVHSIAKMMNNDWGDCSGVEVTFISNSEQTTDLGPINVLARYQMVALFNHYNNLEQYAKSHQPHYVRFFPKLKYYEYADNEDIPESLHTKTTMIGNDLIVGSANADVRSYFMDSNNAVFIRNAFNLNRQYEAKIIELINSARIIEKQLRWHPLLEMLSKKTELTQEEYKQYIYGLTQSLVLDHESINRINEFIAIKFFEDWDKEKFTDPKFVGPIVKVIKAVGEDIMADTYEILTFREKFNTAREMPDMMDRSKLEKEHNELMQKFDKKYQLF